MIKDEIFCYIRDNFTLDGAAASRLMWDIISLLVDEVQNEDDRVSFAKDLMDGMGLEDSELRYLFSM